MRSQPIKEIIERAEPCPHGNSLRRCGSCISTVSHSIASFLSQKCWYCQNGRITRAVTLDFKTHDLVHLVCENCARALDGDSCTFKMLEDQV